MTQNQAIGKVIKELREKHDFTQQKLAELSGLSRIFIAKLEKGDQNPSLETINRLGKAFNLPGSQILQEAEKLY